ncbi:UNVERIFIED_CONTAM: Chaperone protein dnaJ 20, chloroplastic [Sesamum calycinum]|uniref:Chaperone protein dnaJ 20, chloroplastic n=1 Tax=Sesamum calycinum TaxID=2727403 RepID=A0AAW2RRN6_9LAMI
MCSNGVGHLPRSEPVRFSFLHSTRLENPPQFVSFRIRPGPALRSSLNDTISERPAMSFYELLGIPETGSLVEIKQAYKQLARKYHPDVSPPGRAEEYTQTFIRVQEAYETLSDPRESALRLLIEVCSHFIGPVVNFVWEYVLDRA